MRRSTPCCLGLLAVLLAAAPASAALRSPQVPVSGTALATFFATQSQTINPNTDQVDLQSLSVDVGAQLPLHTFVDAAASVGFYNAGLASPPLYLVYPGAATTGWFGVAAFRSSPDRLVVNLFDANATLQGTMSYLAGPPDRTNFAIYVTDGAGPFYQQDARNEGGASRILAYNGTGLRAGSLWLACETGAGPGGDFADVVVLLQLASLPVAVEHSSWGALKRRFR